jgi:hypothetical protein
MTIWKIPRRKTPPKRQTKTCESCGQAFICNQGGCWCDALELAYPALEALRMKYRECLCEECLKFIVTSQSLE